MVFTEDDAPDPAYHTFVKVEPTVTGRSHPALQLAANEDESLDRWSTLPELLTFNPLHGIKPGATTLLTGSSPDLSEDHVVLAFQRYGRGKSLSLAVQDTWTWQFHADIPLEDMTHETFWRQMLRWLVDGVPDQVTGGVAQERVEPGEAVTLTAMVDDSTYLEMNNSSVTATVTTPIGDEFEVPLDWTVDRDGEYEATFVPLEEGLHELRVSAYQGEDLVGTDETFFQVAPRQSEYFDASMRGSLLRRIADETGGRFYTPETVSTLPEDLRLTGAGVTLVEEMDLWDMPILLLLLLAVILSEWGYRRVRGLV